MSITVTGEQLATPMHRVITQFDPNEQDVAWTEVQRINRQEGWTIYQSKPNTHGQDFTRYKGVRVDTTLLTRVFTAIWTDDWDTIYNQMT